MWHTKELPPKMKEASDSIKVNNPEFNYYLYDLDECRDFLINHFEASIINAYDNLLPMAFKTDLWRCCLLYIRGGIYYDIKFKPINNFKFNSLIDKEYFCRDMHPPDTAINGLIVCKPGNLILYNCIQQIVENVKNKYFGLGSLDPTGPILLTNCLSNEEKEKLKNPELRLRNDIYIYYKDNIILMRYPEYREEQSIYQITEHYDKMWREGNVYKN